MPKYFLKHSIINVLMRDLKLKLLMAFNHALKQLGEALEVDVSFLLKRT